MHSAPTIQKIRRNLKFVIYAGVEVLLIFFSLFKRKYEIQSLNLYGPIAKFIITNNCPS